MKSSRKKQNLHTKVLKHQTRDTELAHKSHENLFESMKKKYYSET